MSILKQSLSAVEHLEVELNMNTLINSMVDIVIIKDEKGRWIEANEKACNLFQLSNNRYIGMTDLELAEMIPLHHDSFLACMMSDERTWNTGVSSRFQEVIEQPDCTAPIFDVIKVPLYNPDGSRNKLITIAHNITEEVQAKKDLEESELRYKSLIDQSPNVIFTFDLQGTIISVNSSALETFGYDEQDFLQQSCFQFVVPEDVEKTLVHFQKAKLGKAQSYEVTGIHKNGDRIDLHVINVPIVTGNEVVGVYGLAKDITESKQLERKLKTYQERSESFFRNTPDAVAVVDLQGNILKINSAFEKLYGWSKEELIGETLPFITKHLTSDFFGALKSGFIINEQETIRQRKDGSWIIVSLTLFPIKDENEDIVAIAGISRDITIQKKAEEKLRQSEERFRALVQNSSDVFAIVDTTGIIKYISPAVENVLGFKPEDRIGSNIVTAVNPEDRYKIKPLYEKVISQPKKLASDEFRILHANGSWHDFEVTVQNLLHEISVNGIVINYRDITEKKLAEEQIKHMAYHDALTDLPNRKAFEEHVILQFKQAKLNNQMLSIMILDLDRFKFINDSFGHLIGDKLLQEVSRKLSQCVWHNDMIARIGGDEFIFQFAHLENIDEAIEKAKNLLEIFDKPIVIDDYEFYITASIGISTYPEDGNDIESLIRNADTALYRAKEQGKNQYQIHTPSMNAQTYKAFVMQNDLNKAIEQNELLVYYQPRVDPFTGKIVSAEALLRWDHHDWGMISPKEFIPLAEESGLIVSIGEWVLRTVCDQIKKWQHKRIRKIPISVNISSKQLMQKDFVSTLTQILEETKLEGKWLELEITESTFLQNDEAISHSIHRLQEIGVKIAIDDFGIGYSSLSRLKQIRFNTLKIDKTFMRGLDADTETENTTITKTMIQLAHSLGMSVVAEGVETEQQLNFLVKNQCDEIQGYLFSRAVPCLDFEKILRIGKCSVPSKEDITLNRRQYFRIDLFCPLSADMTIVSVQGRNINVGTTFVLLKDIGPGGLRFLSHVRLPINPNIIIQFKTTIFEEIQLQGHVVWNNETEEEEIQEYGLQFIINEPERDQLTQLLNHLAIQLRKSPIIPECRFSTESEWAFFKKITSS